MGQLVAQRPLKPAKDKVTDMSLIPRDAKISGRTRNRTLRRSVLGSFSHFEGHMKLRGKHGHLSSIYADTINKVVHLSLINYPPTVYLADPEVRSELGRYSVLS